MHSGWLYLFFILLQNLFAVNNVYTFLHLVQSLTCEVVDKVLRVLRVLKVVKACSIIVEDEGKALDLTATTTCSIFKISLAFRNLDATVSYRIEANSCRIPLLCKSIDV